MGARAIVLDSAGFVTLVRHSYENGWFLPGGKVHKGEKPVEAARRELREEIGLSVGPNAVFELLGCYQSNREYKRDEIVVFTVKSQAHRETEGTEIKTIAKFDPDRLPEDTSPGTRRRLEELAGQRPIDWTW